MRPYSLTVAGERRKMRALESTGLDRLMCLMQFGTLAPEAALRSIEVVGKHLVPEFSRDA